MSQLLAITANNSGFDIQCSCDVNGWDCFEVGGLGLKTWLKQGEANIFVKFSREDISAELPFTSDEELGKSHGSTVFAVATREQVYQLLSRACILGHTLPNQALYDYEKVVETEINSKGIVDTEAIAQIKRRVGQERYRKALIDYWGNRCAVTGLSNSILLRASHAKGWAECESDAERLDVYNGFLLCVNLDSVFDTGLISFDDDGRILISDRLSETDLATLNITAEMQLSKIHSRHHKYLNWHRINLFR